MPNITEYNAPQGQRLQPSDIGETSKVRAAARISANADETGQKIKAGFAEIGSFVNQYQAMQEHKDMANGFAAGAAAEKNASTENEDTLKQTGFTDQADAVTQLDNNLIAKHQAILDATSNPKIRATLTEHFAERQLYDHDKNRRDVISMSGAQADNALNEMGNTLSGHAEQDPTQMLSLAQSVPDQIKAIMAGHPNMSPEQAAIASGKMTRLMQGKILEAGFSRMAQTNPGAIDGMLKGLPPDLQGTFDGNRMRMVAREAQNQMKQSAVLGREAAALGRAETARKTDAQFAGRIAQSMHAGQPPDPKIAMDAMDAAAKGLIPLDHAHTIGEIAQSRTMQPEAQIQSNQPLLKTLQDRMFLAPGDPNRLSPDDINKAEISATRGEPGLSRPDADYLHKQLMEDANDPNLRAVMGDFSRVTEKMANLVNPANMMGQKIPGLDVREAQYMNEKRTQFYQMFKKGIDPNEMLNDTHSVNFLFKDMSERLSIDKATADQLLAGMVAGGVTPKLVPLSPGKKDDTIAEPEYNGVTSPGLKALIEAGQKGRGVNIGGQ